MAIHWQIKFKAIRSGTDYTVNIYDDTYSGSPLQLKGGAQPFTTQEDDNEDMFTPVRTQTGYFRIVDDGFLADGVTAFNWKTLLPSTDTDRPVTLTAGGVTLWQGFMQSQDFGSKLYGNPQERELPIHCPLTVTEGTDINYTQTEIQNFAYLLKQIIDSIPATCRPTSVKVQGGADAQAWLLKRIDWQNFCDIDNDGNLSARFNLFQCLEDICRFWGWTARIHRQTLYLTCVDDTAETTWLTMTYANLTTMAGGTAAGDATGPFTSLTLSGDIFASTDNDDFLQRGANRATVTVNGNKADSTFLMFAPDSFIKTMIDGGWQTRIQDDDKYVTYTVDKTECTLPLMEGSATQNKASFNVANYQNSLLDDGDEQAVIRIKTTYSSAVFAQLQTVYQHSFKGYLVLRGTIYRKAHKFESLLNSHDEGNSPIGNKTMIMRLGIGASRSSASWWNGRQWSDTMTTFSATIGNSDDIFRSKYGSGTSYFYNSSINVGGKSGLIFVDFLGSSDLDDMDGQKSFEIASFSLTISQEQPGRLMHGDEWANTQTYKSSNNNNVRMDWNADCIYASDNNMANGFGVLLNADNTHMTTVSYGGSNQRPEQHLADRVTTYWSASKRRMKTELRSSVLVSSTLIRDLSPQHKLTLDGTTCYPISINQEWRDDITIFTLLQI